MACAFAAELILAHFLEEATKSAAPLHRRPV
jgi:hypothetical protein